MFGQPLCQQKEDNKVMNKYLDKAGLQDFATKLTEKYKTLFSSPLTASTVAGMTDHTKVYVYTGSETGYTSGHWYFWNGSAWADGGVYNAEAINTDTTLSISGAAADSKVTGDEIAGLKSALDITNDCVILNYIYQNAFINTSGAIGSVVNTTPITYPGWGYCITNANEGDVFYINGTGGDSPRLWCFVDAEYQIISHAGESVSGNNLVLVAPNGASHLILNSNSKVISYKGLPLKLKLGAEVIGNETTLGGTFYASRDYNVNDIIQCYFYNTGLYSYYRITSAVHAGDALSSLTNLERIVSGTNVNALGVMLGLIEDTNDELNYLCEIPVSWISGKYIYPTNGGAATNAAYKITDFIPINEIRKTFHYNVSVSNAVATYALYDKQKAYIPGSARVVSSSSLTVDEGEFLPSAKDAAYIRFTSAITYEAIIKVSALNNNELVLSKSVGIDNLDSSIAIHDPTTNMIDMQEIVFGKYINDVGGLTDSSGFNCTGYVPIEDETNYYQHNILWTYYAYYDSNYNFLASYSTLGNLPSHFTTPEGAAYGRFTITDASLASGAWINLNNETPKAYKMMINNHNLNFYTERSSINVENPCDYDGKEIAVFNKICCVGDSITAGVFNHNEGGTEQYLVEGKYSYPTYIKKLYGVDTENWGLSGHTSVEWWTTKQNSDFSGFDCVIINLGINDALRNVPIEDTETAFRNIINAFKTANNNVKIFLATIVPAYADDVTTYDNVNALITDLADEITNCYLVDLTHYSHTSKGTAYEAGHLTAIGYRLLAQDYGSYIGYIIRTNLTDFKWVQFIGTNYSKN